jgi:2-aminobenzoate-CoA ligase
MSEASAPVDSFARDQLPPREQWPVMLFERPELRYPPRLNCAVELLDKTVATGNGARRAIVTPDETWSYAELLAKSNRIARVLSEDLGLVPGNRVLLRAANSAMLAACWLAVVKAGGIAVTTMPLLRARELAAVIDKAAVRLALCDERLSEELTAAQGRAATLERIVSFGGPSELERRMADKPSGFQAADTAAEDTCLIAFTSGTTGGPKGTMHFHRDVLAICDSFARAVLKPRADDLFCGSPPLGFTFGLGGLLLFPLRVGAATLLLEQAAPELLLDSIARFGASVLFTAPTGYRAMLDKLGDYDTSSLRRCVSAGETLPKATFEAWRAATGGAIIDGIGSTELLHIFISAADEAIRPGATGLPVPGYEARVLDDEGQPVPPGTVGRLAVRGPTGCRYLGGDRQTTYVADGWNLTGDAYRMDEDGYFWFQARTDDMIISAGYNIAGPEVENVLLEHAAVRECAVVAAPDRLRGNIVKAFVALRPDVAGNDALIEELQNFVKRRIAPYKYPRAIEFIDALPKTGTGKLQRFKLRQMAAERAAERQAKAG